MYVIDVLCGTSSAQFPPLGDQGRRPHDRKRGDRL